MTAYCAGESSGGFRRRVGREVNVMVMLRTVSDPKIGAS